MTSQRRVKEYLDKNKISPLFEDLMTKLMHAMPNDPLTYLVSVLERKIDKKKQVSGEAVRKSTSALSAAPAEVDPVSLWTVSGSALSKEPRAYEKPWTSNARPRSSMRTEPSMSKSTKARTDSSPVRKSSTKVAWNHDTKTPSGDFDELWRVKQEITEKPPVTSGTRKSQSPDRRQQKRAKAMEELELTFTSHGYTGPRRITTEQKEEFTTPRPALATKQTEISHQKICRYGKHRHRPSRNKQELRSFLEVEKRDSGVKEEVEIDDQEDGTEIYEDTNDLRREGVTNIKTTGLRVKPSCEMEKSPVVRVSICGRCARVMTAGSEPISRRAGTFTDAPTYDIYASAQFTQNLDDDEFESVSQVSGPRRPVWIEDDKVSSPRKGTSMMESRGQPRKGRPMYTRPRDDSSPDITDNTDQSPSPPQIGWNDTPVPTEGEELSADSPEPVTSVRPWPTPTGSDFTDWAPERVRRERLQNKNGTGRF